MARKLHRWYLLALIIVSILSLFSLTSCLGQSKPQSTFYDSGASDLTLTSAQFSQYLLFRFDTNVINIGTASYYAPSPYDRPDLLIYAQCHQHYHEDGFAFYWLSFVENNTVALQSLKRSYCVETSGAWGM